MAKAGRPTSILQANRQPRVCQQIEQATFARGWSSWFSCRSTQNRRTRSTCSMISLIVFFEAAPD